MHSLKKLHAAFGLILVAAAPLAHADSNDKAASTKVAFNRLAPAYSTPVAAAKDADLFLFSAPPGASADEDAAKYQPIADLLSRVTGKRFVYQRADSWLSYSKNMAGGAYDLAFDGSALNSWRIERINHTPLVKLPEDLVFTVVARADDARVGSLKHLAGHPVCTVAAPDVGALALLSQFDNPARQPVIAAVADVEASYQGVMQGKCAGGVVTRKYLDAADRKLVKVLYEHRAVPNHAFSAGPRLSPGLKDQVRDALLSTAGKTVTAKVRAAHGGGDFLPATPAEYAGLGGLLKNSLYYY